MRFVPPPALRPSDKVAVVAPASAFDRKSFEAGLAVLSRRYQPSFSPGVFAEHRYLAGDDSRRLAELSEALSDPSVKAIFAARGGYGVMRLLPALRLDGPPKLLVGFSDLTALHLALQAAGRTSIHGPVLTQLGKQPAEVAQRLFHLLESTEPPRPLTGAAPLVPGIAEGPLVGGNLSVLSRLVGTPFFPPLEGAVLLLEDVGERPYRLDRMWTHLRLAGAFERAAGIALGEFTGCEEKDASYQCADVLRSLAEETKLPCAVGFGIGHGAVNLPVALGSRVRLDASAGTLEHLEPAVSEPRA
ncbi:MAG: LD-carboxypeptidase [Myxococcales bacterium]|nr:LD-carboxypeptidase [Myxococcales bacterium]